MGIAASLTVLNELAAVGITQAKIDKAIGEDLIIRGAVIQKAKEVQEYWQSIAPVNKTGRPHTLKSGYVDYPGDYKKSIKITYHQKATGFFSAKVETKDYKAHWLEYGSIHNPEYGFAQKVVDHFGGRSLDGHKSVSS